MIYFNNLGNNCLTPLANFKECKVVYTYTDEAGWGRRLKKHKDQIFIEANSSDEAYKKLAKVHNEKFKEYLLTFENLLREKLIGYDFNEIIGIEYPSEYYHTIMLFKDDFSIDKIELYTDTEKKNRFIIPGIGGISYNDRKAQIKKIITKISREYGRDFSVDINIDTREFVINPPKKENISLGNYRNELMIQNEIYPDKYLRIHISDHTQYRWKFKNSISLLEFERFGISYSTLLKNSNGFNHANDIALRRDYTTLVIKHDYDDANPEEAIATFALYDYETSAIKSYESEHFFIADKIKETIKNTNIHIIYPALEIHTTFDDLCNLFCLNTEGRFVGKWWEINKRISNYTVDEDTNKCVIRKIREQLEPSEWKAFLLLNEVNPNYDV